MRADYRHAYRLIGLLVVAGASLAALRWLAVPEGFGQVGRYRAAAPAEIAKREPRHLGEAACKACHLRQVRLHDKDAHTHVPCESCHGPGAAHIKARQGGAKGGLKSSRMRVPDGRQDCLVCHQRLPARMTFFPQVEAAEHERSVGVKDPGVACVRCHDPHEPLYMDRGLRSARLHPLVHRCRDCHVGGRDAATPKPAGHPAIFECGYCHGQIANDARGRSHKKIACTTCHLFFKESEFAGRIIRDTDPRFCLLCHGQTDFRSAQAPPSISWPAHREEMGGEGDARCIDCHRDHIHRSPGKESQAHE